MSDLDTKKVMADVASEQAVESTRIAAENTEVARRAQLDLAAHLSKEQMRDVLIKFFDNVDDPESANIRIQRIPFICRHILTTDTKLESVNARLGTVETRLEGIEAFMKRMEPVIVSHENNKTAAKVASGWISAAIKTSQVILALGIIVGAVVGLLNYYK